MKSILTLAALAALAATPAEAHEVTRIPGPPTSPILAGVLIPGGSDLFILSGQVPSPIVANGPADQISTFGDTKTQALSAFARIEALLKAQGYALSDVVKLTVFLVGDPANGGKLDFKGFNEAYSTYFGTAAQPNKTARSVVQVAALAAPGFLVEIEAIAVKPPVHAALAH